MVQFTGNEARRGTRKLQRRISGREEITDFTVDQKDRFCYGKDKALDYELEEGSREDWKSRR